MRRLLAAVAPARRATILRFGLFVLVAMALFLPAWALYLAVVLPREHVSPDWDVLWVGFDLGLALLAAGAFFALRRQSAWTPLIAGALASALVCDAWFDVLTSSGDDRLLAVGLALVAELPVAAVAVVVGIRSVRLAARRGG